MSKQKLHGELVALFGRGRVEQAEITDVVDLGLTAALMDEVQATADAMLRQAGKPHKQRELVDGLDDTTSLVLCMWLLDTGFASRLYDDAA